MKRNFKYWKRVKINGKEWKMLCETNKHVEINALDFYYDKQTKMFTEGITGLSALPYSMSMTKGIQFIKDHIEAIWGAVVYCSKNNHTTKDMEEYENGKTTI